MKELDIQNNEAYTEKTQEGNQFNCNNELF